MVGSSVCDEEAVRIGAEYAASLADLTANKKPLINMLSMLAEDYIEYAEVIIDSIDKYLQMVHPKLKLTVLYLVDSIIKNVGGAYTREFSKIIVKMFTKTFKQVDEKTRSQMFKLRQTWSRVFSPNIMYTLDTEVSEMDKNWQIQCQPQSHYLEKPTTKTNGIQLIGAPLNGKHGEMRAPLSLKKRELIFDQEKIGIKLEQTKPQLEVTKNTVKQERSVVRKRGHSPDNFEIRITKKYNAMCEKYNQNGAMSVQYLRISNNNKIRISVGGPCKIPGLDMMSNEDEAASASLSHDIINLVDDDDNTHEDDALKSEKADVLQSNKVDEGEEDDVVLKAEPVEQVVVDDDADTDDETQAERDRLAADFRLVRVKQEPIDPDYEPEHIAIPTIDLTSTKSACSIDGNDELGSYKHKSFASGTGIKLNISRKLELKKTPSLVVKKLEESDEDEQQDEELMLNYKVKPSLNGVNLTQQPMVQGNAEASSLCCIM